jgi:hypothetical protein
MFICWNQAIAHGNIWLQNAIFDLVNNVEFIYMCIYIYIYLFMYLFIPHLPGEGC